jgi:hypothetical protein
MAKARSGAQPQFLRRVCAARATMGVARRRASGRMCLWVTIIVGRPPPEVAAYESEPAYAEIGDEAQPYIRWGGSAGFRRRAGTPPFGQFAAVPRTSALRPFLPFGTVPPGCLGRPPNPTAGTCPGRAREAQRRQRLLSRRRGLLFPPLARLGGLAATCPGEDLSHLQANRRRSSRSRATCS